MVLDHVNRALLGNGVELFAWAGRVSFPLFALLIAYNIQARDVHWRRYVTPLLLAGLIAQIPFSLVVQPLLNIMFTLLLGVLCIPFGTWLERYTGKGTGLLAWVLIALVNLGMDYPLFGAWLVPLGVFAVRRRDWIGWIPFLAFSLLSNFFTPHAFIVLLLPLILFTVSSLEGARFKVPRWAWYAFYPAHLVVLAVLQRL
jgi:TraX protein